MAEFTISKQSRNLGYGWSNRPVQCRNENGFSSLGFEAPTKPDAQGGLRAVLAERDRASRLNRGNDWTAALFVAGQRVTHYESQGAWVRLERLEYVIDWIAEGFAVRVRTEEA